MISTSTPYELIGGPQDGLILILRDSEFPPDHHSVKVYPLPGCRHPVRYERVDGLPLKLFAPDVADAVVAGLFMRGSW